jgi:ribosomal protein S3
MEMYVTIAAAAMIIGKKGLKLKQLQAKSNAVITLDQMQQVIMSVGARGGKGVIM